MFHARNIALIALAALSNPIWAAPVVCSQGQLSRSIEVVYGHPELALPCEVIYDKINEGTQSILWRAENAQGYCEEQADQLIRKHIDWGWACTAEGENEPEAPSLEDIVGSQQP